MSKTKKVLVFTNRDTWKRNINSNPDLRTTNWNNNYPDPTHCIKECDFSKSETDLEDVIPDDANNYANKDGIYLIFDSIDDNNFNQLKKMCANNELYVLTHSSGRTVTQDDFSAATTALILPGTHNNEPEDHYYPIFKILKDTEGDKLNRIINEVFKTQLELETVLLFLHGCLGDSRNNDFDKSYQKLHSIPSIQGSVTDFYNKYFAADSYNGQKGGSKTADLAALRDELLKYVSTQA